MYRSHNCGELRLENVHEQITLSGWVQKVRNKGGMIWVDLRDRYGITQLALEDEVSSREAMETAKKLGREYVITATGEVIERLSKTNKIETGAIEIKIDTITVLNEALTPPFTIEDETDGGEELRMKYRYLDIRRNTVKEKLIFRSQRNRTRKYSRGSRFS